MVPVSSFTPALVSFPVLGLFPSSPVPVKIPVLYPPVITICVPVIWGEVHNDAGNPCRGKICPGSVIPFCPVPAAFIRPIPVAVIEDNIHRRVRREIRICPRYYHHRRRRGEAVSRYVDPYAYIDPCFTPGRECCQAQEQYCRTNKQNRSLLLHDNASFAIL